MYQNINMADLLCFKVQQEPDEQLTYFSHKYWAQKLIYLLMRNTNGKLLTKCKHSNGKSVWNRGG